MRMIPNVIISTSITLALTGCAFTAHESPLNSRAGTSYSSSSYNERIRYIVIHYTALNDRESLKVLTSGEVSAHYLISEKNTCKDARPCIYQLVPDDKRAWHSGKSEWNGRSHINDTSIGIEIVNLGFTADMHGHKTWYPYTSEQITSLTDLLKRLADKYNIPPENIIAHSDIAPLRKSDPGKLFPWKQLADAGLGAWPDEDTVAKYLAGRSPISTGNIFLIQQALYKYGYTEMPQTGMLDETTHKILSAFQLHFRPNNIEGFPDAETEALALALVEKYRS